MDLNKFTGLIKEHVPIVLEKVKKIKRPLIIISCFYVGLLLLLVLTWYGAWWYSTWKHGSPDLASLSNFISICIGSSAIAAVTFVAGLFIDMDNDGVPDVIEKTTKVAQTLRSPELPTVISTAVTPSSDKNLKQPLRDDSGLPKQ